MAGPQLAPLIAGAKGMPWMEARIPEIFQVDKGPKKESNPSSYGLARSNVYEVAVFWCFGRVLQGDARCLLITRMRSKRTPKIFFKRVP